MRYVFAGLIVALLLLGCTGTATNEQPPVVAPETGGTPSVLPETPSGPPEEAEPPQINEEQMEGPETVEIQITARQWEFEPNPITVKKGQRVVLHITSEDVAHGFTLLEFGITNKRLEPGQTVTVEFTPEQAGTYSFFCSVFCGAGHGGMRGTLIVTE